MHPLFALAPAFALLVACATGTQEQAAAPVQATPAPEPEPIERAIPQDSLYPLLVAEFALRRREYGLALEQYLEQSEILRDPAVSAHTTHLAQFMQREQEALRSVQLWVELEPDNMEANNTLATLLVRQGRSTEALPHLAVVLEQGGDPKFPILLNDFEDLSSQQQAELVGGLNGLAADNPDNIQLALAQALILAQYKQYGQAQDRLDTIFELDPYQHQAILLEAKLLIEQGDPKPFTRLEAALDKNPDDQRLRLQYARLLAVNDLPAARKQFEVLSAQSPRDGDLLLSLALINREIGDDLEAKAYLRQLIALGQRTGEANYYLGRIAEDNGEDRTALYHYRQVEGGREMLSAAQRGGLILLQENSMDEYREWFAQWRGNHPRNSEQLYALESELLTQTGQLDAAMDVLNAGLENFPESNTLRYARSMLGEQQDDLELMESDLRNIIERDPDNATALNALGYTLANRTDRYDEAYDLITRALELQPDEPAILDSMGWVLYRKGNYTEALDYLSRAYAVFPDPEVAAHLGEVMWVSGDTEGATRIWQGALMKDPDHKVLVSTLERLGVTDLVSAGKGQIP